jgi:hypothetical protein
VSWESDLLVGLAQNLAGQGVGVYSPGAPVASTDTLILFGELPTSPDRCIALTLYASRDEPVQNLSTVRVQFMFRGAANNTLDVGDLAASVFGVLQGVTHRDYGTAHAVDCLRVSTVPLGMDGNKRMTRADNYEIPVNTPYTAGRTP